MKQKIERPCIFKNDSRENLANFSRKVLLTRPKLGCIIGMVGTPEDWTYYTIEYHSCVLGPSVFWKKSAMHSLSFKKGRLFGKTPTPAMYIDAAAHLGKEWVKSDRWITELLALNKTLWSMVFSGKITNPEQLAKRYSRLYFKGAYSYRNLKAYFQHLKHIGSLWDIYYYTTNPDYYLTRAINGETDPSMIVDIFRYCAYDNSKINPAWTPRRLAEFHQKQIEKDMAAEASSKSTTLIAPAFGDNGLFLILDEYTAFMESQIQHNCVYRCYWPAITRGEYLIAKGTFNGERVTLGMDIDHDVVVLNQIHTIYNRFVNRDTEDLARKWIKDNQAALLATAYAIKANPKNCIEPKDYDYIPF